MGKRYYRFIALSRYKAINRLIDQGLKLKLMRLV